MLPVSGATDEALVQRGRVGVVGASTPLLVSVAVSSIGGVAFSALAAHQVESRIVGVYATLFFWVMLVNQLTSFGLPVVVSRIPADGAREGHSLLMWALSITAASSVLGAGVAALVMGDRVRGEVHDAVVSWGAWRAFVVFALTVAGLSLALLVDLRFVITGRGSWAVGRVLVVNVLRCGLLLVPTLRTDAMSLLILNAGVNAASGVVGALVLARTPPRGDGERGGTANAVPLAELRFGLLNWLGGLSVLVGQYGFPLVADASLKENAAFFLAWQIGAMVFVVPVMVGYAVVVSVRGDADDGLDPGRKGLLLSVLVVTAGAAVAAVIGKPMLRAVFGQGYAVSGTLLPWLLLAGLPWCWLSMALAKARGVEDRAAVLALTVPYGPVVLALAWAMARDAPLEAAQTWAAGNFAAAVVGGVALEVTRAVRCRRDG